MYAVTGFFADVDRIAHSRYFAHLVVGFLMYSCPSRHYLVNSLIYCTLGDTYRCATSYHFADLTLRSFC